MESNRTDEKDAQVKAISTVSAPETPALRPLRRVADGVLLCVIKDRFRGFPTRIWKLAWPERLPRGEAPCVACRTFRPWLRPLRVSSPRGPWPSPGQPASWRRPGRVRRQERAHWRSQEPVHSLRQARERVWGCERLGAAAEALPEQRLRARLVRERRPAEAGLPGRQAGSQQPAQALQLLPSARILEQAKIASPRSPFSLPASLRSRPVLRRPADLPASVSPARLPSFQRRIQVKRTDTTCGEAG